MPILSFLKKAAGFITERILPPKITREPILTGIGKVLEWQRRSDEAAHQKLILTVKKYYPDIDAEKSAEKMEELGLMTIGTVAGMKQISTRASRLIKEAARKGISSKTIAKIGKIPEEKLTPLVPKVKPPRIKPSPPPLETPEFAATPISNPIAKLTELLKKAKPLRKGLERKYTAERAVRIAKVDEFINTQIDKVGGEEGYAKILSKLKGELAKPEAKIRFEPLKSKLTEAELKDLYIRTWKHPYLDNWEKISSANELSKLLGGEIPTAKGLFLL